MNRAIARGFTGRRVIAILAVCLIASFLIFRVADDSSSAPQKNPPPPAYYQALAQQITSSVEQITDAGTPKLRKRAPDIPEVLIRVGPGKIVYPTDWCSGHKTICTNELTRRLAAQPNSNAPTPHALDNMRRVFFNAFNGGARSAKRQTALQAWNHYKDDMNGGVCQPWVTQRGNDYELWAPAWLKCRPITWGGSDGSDGGVNFDNLNKGVVLCETAILGTAAGQVVLTMGAAAPTAVLTIGAGQFGCGAVWLVDHFLF